MTNIYFLHTRAFHLWAHRGASRPGAILFGCVDHHLEFSTAKLVSNRFEPMKAQASEPWEVITVSFETRASSRTIQHVPLMSFSQNPEVEIHRFFDFLEKPPKYVVIPDLVLDDGSHSR